MEDSTASKDSRGKSFKRIRVRFARDLEVDFTGRISAIERVIKWGEEGMSQPVVVFGPEGCGKSTWLRQTIEILKGMGYKAIYVNPTETSLVRFAYDEDLGEVVREAFKSVMGEAVPIAGVPVGRLAELAFEIVAMAVRRLSRTRIDVLVDEAFKAVGIRNASLYVKSALNVMEHPKGGYDKLVAILTTSEGLSRSEVGRHRWADLVPMWNMSREDFRELYNKIPGEKPSFEEIWEWAGGNLWILRELYEARWNVEEVVEKLIDGKRLDSFVRSLSSNDRRRLEKAIEDPDTLFNREGMPVLNRLVELNLAVDDIPGRKPSRWIDRPPPKKDLNIGIGEYVAWQTPLHREALKRALKQIKT